MKAPLTVITLALLLASCTLATSDEKNRVSHQMHNGNGTMMAGTFLPGQNRAIDSLPNAKNSEVLEVRDGETITLNPELARTTLHGKTFAVYAYNGQFPGPTLRVQQGSTFTVKVTNMIDVPTSIHWHGIRLDNRFDGAAGVTQEAIEPGTSFIYTVTVPDEGMYWYHTHVREDMQQPMGLYGGIIVLPKNTEAYGAVDQEETVILSDLLLDNNGMPVPYGQDDADHVLMGRFGNTFLINGKIPEPIQVGLGTVVRFSILNASSTRTYRVTQPKDSLLKIVGGDSGRYEREFLTSSYVLAPSERVIAEVYFWDDGVNRGMPQQRAVTLVEAGSPSNPIPILSATIVGGVVGTDRLPDFQALRQNRDIQKDIDEFRPFFDKPVDKTIHLSVASMTAEMMMQGNQGDMQHGMGHGGMVMEGQSAEGIEWEDTMSAMNQMSTKVNTEWKMIDEASGRENMDISYRFKAGDKVKIRIVNDTESENSDHPMQHPIHFHGQRILVLSVDGTPNENLAWKDTVLVGRGQTVDILVDMSNPGEWMFHCHIAEHLMNGMMGMFRVQ